MSEVITPEIVSSFNEELEKIARKAPVGFLSRLFRSVSKRPYVGGGSSRVYSSGRGKFMNRKGGYISGQEMKSGKFKTPGKKPATPGVKKDGVIKTVGKGILGAGILSGMAVIGGAAGSPSPKRYR